MKTKILLLTLSCLFTANVQAQQKLTLKELTGTWEVFSMDIPGEIYFNLQTDSIAVKPEDGEDSTMIAFKNKMIKESLKAQVSKMFFYMDSDGTMYDGTLTKDPTKKMGSYMEDKAVLRIKEKETGEEKEIRLSLKDNVLTMLTEDKGVRVTMLCKKRL